jgi:hypothetical protein
VVYCAICPHSDKLPISAVSHQGHLKRAIVVWARGALRFICLEDSVTEKDAVTWQGKPRGGLRRITYYGGVPSWGVRSKYQGAETYRRWVISERHSQLGNYECPVVWKRYPQARVETSASFPQRVRGASPPRGCAAEPRHGTARRSLAGRELGAVPGRRGRGGRAARRLRQLRAGIAAVRLGRWVRRDPRRAGGRADGRTGGRAGGEGAGGVGGRLRSGARDPTEGPPAVCPRPEAPRHLSSGPSPQAETHPRAPDPARLLPRCPLPTAATSSVRRRRPRPTSRSRHCLPALTRWDPALHRERAAASKRAGSALSLSSANFPPGLPSCSCP